MFRKLTLWALPALAFPIIANSAPTEDIASAVAADWPRHDRAGKGHLTQAEFVSWLTALRAQSGATTDNPAKVKAWADTAFAKTDVDDNNQVTPEEFAKFIKEKSKRR